MRVRAETLRSVRRGGQFAATRREHFVCAIDFKSYRPFGESPNGARESRALQE
jgi:hypothetical protein